VRDDIILTAIDEAVGSKALCACGKEFHLTERGDMLWLECPTFAGPTRLPASAASFLRELVHDRRPVAALPSAPALVPVAVTVPVTISRPVSIRG
jgi:hypothetical protein